MKVIVTNEKKESVIVLKSDNGKESLQFAKGNPVNLDEKLLLKFSKAIAMLKIAHDDSPNYLRDIFNTQEQANTNNTITLRSVTNMNFWIFQSKLEIYKNSLSYSGPVVWNSLPKEMKMCQKLTSFKNMKVHLIE